MPQTERSLVLKRTKQFFSHAIAGTILLIETERAFAYHYEASTPIRAIICIFLFAIILQHMGRGTHTKALQPAFFILACLYLPIMPFPIELEALRMTYMFTVLLIVTHVMQILREERALAEQQSNSTNP